jgi:predicted SprT family Zn-dependent metalloprotease
MKKVETLFNELTKKFGLTDWKLEFNNRIGALGQCSYNVYTGYKRIKMSKKYLVSADWATNENTLRHELAHALDVENRGTTDHSWRWKECCAITGADPNRLCSLPKDQRPQKKYVWQCSEHGETSQFSKLTAKKKRGGYYCRQCFDEDQKKTYLTHHLNPNS